MAERCVQCLLKYREGKKWKQRWSVLKKLSPVADCAHLCLWKEAEGSSHHSSDDRLAVSGASVIVLEEFYGINADFELDFEKYVLSIICRQRIVTLAFQSHKTLAVWCTFINRIFGKGKRYAVNLVKAPAELRLHCGPSHLYVQGYEICLTTRGSSGSPPFFIACWHLTHLCRFGLQCGCFCFVAGERTEFPGIFALETSSASSINELLSKTVKDSLKGSTLSSLDCSVNSVTHCRQLVDAPEFFVNESLLPTGRRLSDLADDCNSAYYNVTTTSNGARRSEPSSVSSRFEADIPSPRALRCNSLSVSRGQQTQKRCIDIPLGFGNRSCETVCFEQSLASGSRMPSKIRDSACCSVPVSESDAACALTQSCDSSYSHNCLHSLDSVSKRSDTAECNREVNWRRHSFGDIYRKLYSVVDGIVSQRWFTRSLSKFMGSSSQADDCTQCSPAAEECQSSVNYAVRSSKSMMYPSTNASCGVNFIQANAGATSSLGPLPSTITNPDKPPPVPPRTAVQLAYNNCQSEIQVQGKNSVKQLYENKPLDHKFDWDARSKDASSELSWRHTVLLCGPEGVSAKMKAATLGDIGRKSRVESQNLETQTVDEKSRLVTKNFRFMRSRSVGNQLCKSSPLCTKCCSICDLPLNVCYCMSSNNETRVSPTSAVSCGRLLLADVDSLCHDQLQSHQSRDHHLLTSSTSSLDQLGPPPPVPCVKIASNSPRVSASEPTVPVDGRESICRNSSIEHGYNKVDVHNSSDSGICRTSGTTGSANHERATRKSNLTVNTAYTAPPSDMSRLSAGMASHPTALPRFLSDLKPHFVQSQPATPAVTATRNPRHRPRMDLHRTTSQASTSLRPRYGKEYLRINRRRLASASAIDWSPSISTPRSPGSQSLSTLCVFDFDTLNCAQGSSRNVNNSQANSIDLDTVWIPQQPMSLSTVNYTDLDLSDTSCKSKTEQQQQQQQHPSTVYACIDFEATAAVSRAGREHVIDRRDNRSFTSRPQPPPRPSGLQA